MNSVHLIGRLTRDPDVHKKEELTITRFSLAISRPKQKDKAEVTDYISCVAFGKTAETIGNYLSKGRRIGVEGSIQTGSYQDKEGKTVKTTDVKVDKFEFLDNPVEKPVETVETQTTISPYEGFEQIDGIPF